MLRQMRTTLHLPDELYREVKRTAAADGSTMTSFVEAALREALHRHQQEVAVHVSLPAAVGEGGVLPGVDLTDSAALADLMAAP